MATTPLHEHRQTLAKRTDEIVLYSSWCHDIYIFVPIVHSCSVLAGVHPRLSRTTRIFACECFLCKKLHANVFFMQERMLCPCMNVGLYIYASMYDTLDARDDRESHDEMHGGRRTFKSQDRRRIDVSRRLVAPWYPLTFQYLESTLANAR